MSDEMISESNYVAPVSHEVHDDSLAQERHSMRIQIQDEVEAFLASGGVISSIAPNIVADPPKKPQSNYGGQPI